MKCNASKYQKVTIAVAYTIKQDCGSFLILKTSSIAVKLSKQG